MAARGRFLYLRPPRCPPRLSLASWSAGSSAPGTPRLSLASWSAGSSAPGTPRLSLTSWSARSSGAVTLIVDFGRVVPAVSVNVAPVHAREGDPAFQHFELELTADSFFTRLHEQNSLDGCGRGSWNESDGGSERTDRIHPRHAVHRSSKAKRTKSGEKVSPSRLARAGAGTRRTPTCLL